jgi:hypothetical protein
VCKSRPYPVILSVCSFELEFFLHELGVLYEGITIQIMKALASGGTKDIFVIDIVSVL